MPRGRARAVSFAAELKERARRLKRETFALYLAARHPRTPWYAKAVVAIVAGYAFSPIDIIPDFIPVIGELDDLAVLIIGLDWFIRNAPPDVVEEHMARIAKHEDTLSKDLDSAGSVLADRAAELRATLERMRSKREGGSE